MNERRGSARVGVAPGASAPGATSVAESAAASASAAAPAEALSYTTLESPLGPILLVGSPTGLRMVSFLSGENPIAPECGWRHEPHLFAEAAQQIHAYFTRELQSFTLVLEPRGTPFQLAVWEALRAIPYGKTLSYGEIARRIGKPAAVRAVGAANGRNPLPLIVPCHRVIGFDGSLTGYHGGLAIKERLLAIEQEDWFA